LIGAAALNANAMLFGAWQTAAPPGWDNSEPWAYAARKFLGNSIALCLLGFGLFLNIRPRWPYLKSRYTWILAAGALLAFLLPRATHFFEIDGCLDRGSKWDYAIEKCISDADA
jgi:hypothetical protein